MLSRKTWTIALVRFLAVYGLLVFPRPLVNAVCASYFCTLGRLIYPAEEGKRILIFERPNEKERPSTDDVRIVIENRDWLNVDGSGLVRNLDMNAQAALWRPLALLASLIMASPVSWKRRFWAFAAGLLAIHAYLWATLAVDIWRESAEISLVTIPEFLQKPLGMLTNALLIQLSLAVPVLVWLLCAFRPADFRLEPSALNQTPVAPCKTGINPTGVGLQTVEAVSNVHLRRKLRR